MDAYTLDTLPGDGETLVLCATRRLAQGLRASWDAARQGTGEKRWRALDARTVGQWIDALGEEVWLRGAPDAVGDARHLDGFQERMLWQRIVGESVGDPSGVLFDVAAMAATAAEAHALATLWNIPVRAPFPGEENQRFQAWHKAFLEHCRRQRLIDASRRQKAVVEGLGEAAVALPARVLFAGFDRFSPLELRLQRTLRERGVGIGALDFSARRAGAARAQACPDRAAECLAAALWAKERLAADPAARLGIIVPDLAGCRALLQDTLDDVLQPSALCAEQAEAPRPYNISLGVPLPRYPLVGLAFELLRLLAAPQPVEQRAVSLLLRSPYWSAAEREADGRARIDAALRRDVAPRAPLERFTRYARHYAGQAELEVPALLADLDALPALRDGLRRRRLPSAWAGVLPKTLARAGWLSGRPLSSHEFQTRQAFLEELRKLADLDALLGEIDAPGALRVLAQLCGERVFQPQTEGDPPLQVMGLLEAAGMPFDALWVMGMSDGAWPPPARPNPLLSAEAQRAAESPNASAAVQLAFAEAIQRRLCASAADITFSWPCSEAAAELRPSPLLGDLAAAAAAAHPRSPHWAVDAHAAAALAPPSIDAAAPPVHAGEKVIGGTGLLRAQAVCPAWAYYRYRLGAAKLEQPVEGLDPARRGSLVHHALEAFWKTVGSQDALLRMDAGARAEAVAQAVDDVLAEYDKDPRREPLKPRFRELEGLRTRRLLLRWLELECERPPFVVIACERQVDAEIEGIAVSMQIDRIDRLEGGALAVIDYKTGARVDMANWATDRLTEPQLPIYASIATPQEASPEGTRSSPVAAVAFAKVLLDEPKFAGIGAADGLIAGVAGLDGKAGRALFADVQRFPDWTAVLDHWRASIGAVAREVKAGRAAVCFADEKALRNCDVLPLLRLAERKAQLEGGA